MKAIISKEEYDAYLKKFLYAGRFRFCIVSILMYLAFSIILSILFDILLDGKIVKILDLKSMVYTIGTAVVWGILFTLIFLPLIKIITKSNANIKLDKSLNTDDFKLYVPCSYKKSKINGIGGMLYIGLKQIYFKPHKLNIGASEIRWTDVKNLEVSVEEQEVHFLAKLLFKNIPKCLLFKDNNRTARFIVPYIDKVITELKKAGIIK